MESEDAIFLFKVKVEGSTLHSHFLAGQLGFEPRFTGLESALIAI